MGTERAKIALLGRDGLGKDSPWCNFFLLPISLSPNLNSLRKLVLNGIPSQHRDVIELKAHISLFVGVYYFPCLICDTKMFTSKV